MQKKITSICFVVLLAALLLPGCKKYEEGPLISFHSALNRLHGTFNINSYTVDGVDSLSLYYDSLATSMQLFYDEDNRVNRFNIEGSRKDGNDGTVHSKFRLNSNSTILIVFASGGVRGTGPFGHLKESQWKILRLTRKEVKMKSTYKGKEYEVFLKHV